MKFVCLQERGQKMGREVNNTTRVKRVKNKGEEVRGINEGTEEQEK